MIHKVRGRLKESCVQFPRLYYLSDKDILQLLSSNGSPISIVPLINRVFPAIKGMQLTEVIPSQSSTTFRKLASKSEEGNSLMPRCMYVYVHMCNVLCAYILPYVLVVRLIYIELLCTFYIIILCTVLQRPSLILYYLPCLCIHRVPGGAS